jgi:hypothetical protein
MHFMPDTEAADSAAERFWPEGYKQVLREELRPDFHRGTCLNGENLKDTYHKRYSGKYTDLTEFTGRIADMLAIGAENGADDAFHEIISAFLTESPLPEVRRYARYLWPETFPEEVKKRLRQIIIDEYSQDEIYRYAYKVGYQKTFPTFAEYMNKVAEIVVTGAMNGADDILEAIYWSFLTPLPLPPARRRPRRLKA